MNHQSGRLHITRLLHELHCLIYVYAYDEGISQYAPVNLKISPGNLLCTNFTAFYLYDKGIS